ncbi:hypothetical protein CVT25_008999 [Psilocybe cyanescens]|uniref:Uncharacterized protein n=1 Tax=Psilocybe cyanescens TaxID=93625 RepID=A0A409XN33_PSICY|nr:hypothetical protein CVT25_008999 [Psilocybe cyanescens]
MAPANFCEKGPVRHSLLIRLHTPICPDLGLNDVLVPAVTLEVGDVSKLNTLRLLGLETGSQTPPSSQQNTPTRYVGNHGGHTTGSIFGKLRFDGISEQFGFDWEAITRTKSDSLHCILYEAEV